MGLSGTLVTLDAGMLPLADIAVGLSRIPRFAGQTLLRWNVSDHLVAGMIYGERQGWTPRQLCYWGLHDAHEAMTSDVPTTFKTDELRAIQRTLDRRLYRALDLTPPTRVESDLVHLLDRGMLLAEAAIVAPPATYRRIVKEMGGLEAEHEHRVAVSQTLEKIVADSESGVAWLDRILPLILDVQEGL